MTEIKYVKGDATAPHGEDNKLICHVCNDVGRWGAGFVIALSRKWPTTKTQYQKWHGSKQGFKLGKVQFVKVEDDIVVCNMIGQHDIKTKGKVAPVRYGAIDKCLGKVALAAQKNGASVHCPRFGAGLAGGSWERIEELIFNNMCENGIQVTVYDFEPS